MAANKKTSKSGAASTPKKKSSARQHAQNRSQSQQHLATPPRVPRSHKAVGQRRFPGETLTGEDRPLDRPGHKQQGFEQDVTRVRTAGRRWRRASSRCAARVGWGDRRGLRSDLNRRRTQMNADKTREDSSLI